MFPQDIIALFVAYMVTTSLIIYGLYENSQGVSRPSLGSVTVTYNKLIDFVQALLLK